MKIHEEANDKIILRVPKFNCDTAYDVTDPLPDKSFYWVIAGPPRSGKTSLLINLLSKPKHWKNYYGVFNNIICCMPDSSRESINCSAFHSGEMIHETELNAEMLQRTLDFLEEETMLGRCTLFIIDDMTSSLKDKSTLKILNHIVNDRRHLRCSLLMLVQFFNSIPLNNRKSITHLALFKSGNNTEYISALGEMGQISKKDIPQIVKYCYREKGDFIYIVTDMGLMYRKFSLLQIS